MPKCPNMILQGFFVSHAVPSALTCVPMITRLRFAGVLFLAATAVPWAWTAEATAEATSNALTAAEKRAGWKLLFDGQNTTGWRSFKKQTFPSQGWVVEGGWLHCLGKGGGDIITDAEFDDFELQWEWKQAPVGNSGVKYFISEKRSSPIGHEYQMIDDAQNPDARLANGRHLTAGVYDVLKPGGTRPKPMGEINQSRIRVEGNHVEHWLNGDKVLEYDCGSDALKQAVAQSKFKNTSGFGEKVRGHLLLQDHHSEVWFRNLKIRELK